VILNDPYKGGTHLPDITLVSGVFSKNRLLFYVASRAHQSDIGGMSPGSMPLAQEIYQEGLRIPPVRVMDQREINRDVWDMILDNDGISDKPIAIRVKIRIRGDSAIIDFSKSDPQAEGSVNAVYAITASAVFYVFRTLVAVSIPSNAGGMRPLEVIAPEGTIVNARPPAAVCGGNVETSQRIVDVLYKCLADAMPDRIPAASQGTMNNLAFGAIDPRTRHPVAYYETVSGGMGARPTMHGLSGVHTHMTNSLNTPVEALEHTYPVRVLRYSL